MTLPNRILLALLAGAGAGLSTRAFAPESEVAHWLVDHVAEPVGRTFLRLLLTTVVPLVFTSLALGAAGLGDARRLGRTGALTLLLFLLSTAVSVVIGLVIAHVAEPGKGLDPAVRDRLQLAYTAHGQDAPQRAADLGIDTIVNIVPTNPVRAAADMQMLPLIFCALD